MVNLLMKPNIGVYYYFYEAAKHRFTNGSPVSTTQSMISGTIAGAAVVAATHPIWTVNVRNSQRYANS